MAEIARRQDQPASLIDQALPEWQWREHHQRLVHASPAAVWQACLDARLGELRITRPLMMLRGLGGKMARDGAILENMPPRPIATQPGHEILLGLVFPTQSKLRDTVQPDSIAMLDASRGAGLIRQAVNVRLKAVPGGTLLSTETRAIANDAAARRRFSPYWALIRPASGLIRHDILRAIARRAEAAAIGADARTSA